MLRVDTACLPNKRELDTTLSPKIESRHCPKSNLADAGNCLEGTLAELPEKLLDMNGPDSFLQA